MDAILLIGGPADGRYLYGEHHGILHVKQVEGGLVVFREARENTAPYRLVLGDGAAFYEHEGDQ